jgi:DNA-binding NarL/FixJ family response regulator
MRDNDSSAVRYPVRPNPTGASTVVDPPAPSNAPSDPNGVQRAERGEALRVVVVDDHAVYRRALSSSLARLGFAVCAQVEFGAHALPATLQHRPHVVLMDQRLPDISGPEATRRILAEAPLTRVLAISAAGGERDLYEAVRAGSVGYIVKTASTEQIANAVRAAAAGHAPLSPAVAVHLLDHYLRTHPAPQRPGGIVLTQRELQIPALVTAGRDNRAIGDALHLSPHTVKGHISAILVKLGVANRVQAAVYAARHGLD